MKDTQTRIHLKTRSIANSNYYRTKETIREQRLHTVCEEAGCPNKFECFGVKTATFLILGNSCTRNCSFCLIDKADEFQLDSQEPYRVAEAVNKLGLKYAVITSVSRDDLPDKGASFFAETMNWIRKMNPPCLIEVLTPDFGGDEKALKKVFEAEPDVFNHNIETVKRLYPDIRAQADYECSLDVLHKAKQYGLVVKSGLMVGMGETQQEIIDVMHDIRATGCDILTIGQYLQPTKDHHEVKRYYRIPEFSFLKQLGLSMNFKVVQSMPLVRSSYRAYDSFLKAESSEQKTA